MNKVSKEEQELTERIFNLYIALRILEQGRHKFVKEAKQVLKSHIKQLKQS